MRFISNIFFKINAFFIILILGSNSVFAETLNYEITAEKLNRHEDRRSATAYFFDTSQ